MAAVVDQPVAQEIITDLLIIFHQVAAQEYNAVVMALLLGHQAKHLMDMRVEMDLHLVMPLGVEAELEAWEALE